MSCYLVIKNESKQNVLFNKEDTLDTSGHIAYKNSHTLTLWHLHHYFLTKQPVVLEAKLLFSDNYNELWWFEKIFSQLRERLISANKIYIEI